MYYDSVYKDNPNFCGQKPNRLLIEILKKKPEGEEALDLGCGQGRDSFYLAKNDFSVTAVDNSKIAISQLREEATRKKLKNIHAVYKDIAKFEIEPDKFSIINCHNALQFLPKKNALSVIESIKKNILPGGFVILASFTAKNPPSKRRHCHFESGEMKELFSDSDFKIIRHFEGSILDQGHIGQPEPHQHGIVEIIARKISKSF